MNPSSHDGDVLHTLAAAAKSCDVCLYNKSVCARRSSKSIILLSRSSSSGGGGGGGGGM